MFIDGLDFSFIDGGHSYSQVRQDFWNVYNRTKKNGIIAIHDIFTTGDKTNEVPLFWSDLKISPAFRMVEIGDWATIEGGIGSGIGVVYRK